MSNLAYYIVCAVLVAGVLGGIAMMSRVKTAVAGNALSAACTLPPFLSRFINTTCSHRPGLGVPCAGFGGRDSWRLPRQDDPDAAGCRPAKRLWRRGFGAGCRGFADGGAHWDILSGHSGPCARSWYDHADRQPHCRWKAAKADLTAPVVWKGHSAIVGLSIVLTAVTVALAAVPTVPVWLSLVLCLCFSGFFGVAFAIRVGGADMPITISLLNSLSGVAGQLPAWRLEIRCSWLSAAWWGPPGCCLRKLCAAR